MSNCLLNVVAQDLRFYYAVAESVKNSRDVVFIVFASLSISASSLVLSEVLSLAGASILGVGGVAIPRWAEGLWTGLPIHDPPAQNLLGRNYIIIWNIIISHLLKRNRIICLDIAVNGQFLPGKLIFLYCLKKLKFFKHLPGKIEIFQTFAWKNWDFSKICLEKSKFLVKLPWKNRNFSEICLEKSKFCWPGSTTPQISNQIDTAGP